MILLLLSINFGFLFRVVKLIEPLSNLLVGRPRAFLSNHVQKLLWKLYYWSEAPIQRWRMMRKGCYFAALALFLTVRVILDHWSSMFFEVYWLVFSFLYGLCSLLANLNAFGWDSIPGLDSMDSDNSGWSFGQVMAVVLLAAPLKTIVEYLYPAERESAPGCDNLTTPRNDSLQAGAEPQASIYDADEIAQPEHSSAFKPDYDYYRGSTALMASTTYIMLAEVGFGSFVIVMAALHSSILALLSVVKLNFGIVLLFLWLIILFSFVIDLAVWKKGKKHLHSILQFANIAILTIAAGFCLFQTSS
ncbi:hypothetical protein CFD26_100797 [Aspergillus turcosus]|uniref:Uncharacterized protein n=1 Tax=Aspergillus turcosus TaxID=1245748 RepID=A0A3R7J0H0_9EURO|nr:hypothetical protein CFD26_100797 [Aspergillus turcosus]